MKKGHVIARVEPGSIAEELGVEPGDRLLTLNGREPEDIFDYQYAVGGESVTMVIVKADGEEWELEIENDYEDPGIIFENSLMSDYRSCRNKCVFCFIDQMPPGMRETLYFKDDDSRLSFLQGNYITLTNMSEHDIDRIIQFHLSPINISVHTTDPALRCRMLNNRFAGEALKKIDRLYEAATPMNGQIVLCKGLNDGEELDRTIRDLSRYVPVMESLSVVPVGLTRYREGLYPLEPLTAEDARRTIEIIEKWQKKIYTEHGIHFVQASDEFYLLAGMPLPEEDRYDGYLQLENGVGMLRLLQEEVTAALEKLTGDDRVRHLSLATGKLAAPCIRELVGRLQDKFPKVSVRVYEIINTFFGEEITVAGLITGQDLIRQLSGEDLGEALLLPSCMFRSGEEVFLDDLTRDAVKSALQVPVLIVKSSGQALVDSILDLREDGPISYEGYELKEMNETDPEQE